MPRSSSARKTSAPRSGSREGGEGFGGDEPTLSEQGGVRYLHFGTEWIQGAMRTSRPADLVLAYTQQMMAWLLFLEPTDDDVIGILGLGAGSLLRYVVKRTPSHVETVEWNPQVTAVCRSFFRLPDHPRSLIHHGDAGDWIAEDRQVSRFRALMVDLYDADAQGPVRDSQAFYDACHRSLDAVGIMTVNLFGNHESFAPNLERIARAFDGRLLEMPEIDAGNRVVLALKGPLLDISTGAFLERAADVEARYRLPARRWAKALLAARPVSPNFAV